MKKQYEARTWVDANPLDLPHKIATERNSQLVLESFDLPTSLALK